MRQTLVNELVLVNQVLAPKLNDKSGNRRKRARSSPADSLDLPELANQPLSDAEQKVEDRATLMTPPTEHTPALKSSSANQGACLGFGHSSRNCKGPDRAKNCFRTADSLLDQLAQEIGVDTLLISDQYRDRDPHFWFPDSLGTAACWVRNSTEAPVQDHGRGRSFVWVRCRDVTLFSVYLTPDEPNWEFRLKIDRLEDSVRGTVGHVVVAGDFNARAVEWGMISTNSRGKYMLDFAARAGLVVLNEGDTPTLRHPGMR
ncbi:uncharacterized protein LOC128983085 [Macrosteles quadrilineatus]|uniref:uncharacterized protein LOC128983085 n=1 Tax=Macrosteles quadrilineatus TaxID=74068 RepID=UPI0023E0DC62|nr:uncharacterized protein LOC128983085 [Macrosteles quadrilineatus]